MIKIVIIGFLILETANVALLYFSPGSKLGNCTGVFNAWEKSKSDPEIHNFVKYLVNWVAGTKLIFILLLIVILLTANEQTLILASGALVISIATFFWRLFPLVRRMDKDGQLCFKGYSIGLGLMIFVFVVVFLGAAISSIA